MRRFRTFTVVVSLIGAGISWARVAGGEESPDPRRDRPTPQPSADVHLDIEAAPERGFNFPYFLFVPKGIDPSRSAYLLVEPNNTGAATDDFEVHRQAAERLARDGYPNRIARCLGSPLLVPAFPRPMERWWAYTHALDRDTLEITAGKLQRIDLQLVAMIGDARERLRARGLETQQRVFLHGYSASGVFANRFAFLHPSLVKAAATGGVNGMPMLPATEWRGEKLPYPVGIADLERLIGRPFDETAYRQVAQYIYMGYLDRNDTVPAGEVDTDSRGESWSPAEVALIRKVIGARMMPDRWETCRRIYAEAGLPVQCVTYNGAGHEIRQEMRDDLVAFFRANSGPDYVPIEPHEYPFVEYRDIREAHVNGLYWLDDDRLPNFIRSSPPKGGSFVIGVEEWIDGQDHRQLEAFVENAGFEFVLTTEGHPNVRITRENYRGTCSQGDGRFQGFFVGLSEERQAALVAGVAYTLTAAARENGCSWIVPDDLTLTRSSKNTP